MFVAIYLSLLTIQSASQQVLPLLYKWLQLLLISLLPTEAIKKVLKTKEILKTVYYTYHIRRTISLRTSSSFRIEESKAMNGSYDIKSYSCIERIQPAGIMKG